MIALSLADSAICIYLDINYYPRCHRVYGPGHAMFGPGTVYPGPNSKILYIQSGGGGGLNSLTELRFD